MADSSVANPKCNESQQTMLLGLSWGLLSLAIVAVLLRLYFRLFALRNGIRGDDYTILAALVAGIMGTGFLTELIYSGVGRHIYCLPKEQISITIKWSIISQIVNVIGIGLVKVSVCLCVLRLIDRARKQLNLFLWILIAFVSASHFAQVILFLVQCRPMSTIWDPRIPGKCFSPHVTYLAGYIGFGLDAFTDLTCAGIPVFVIHQLQMSKRTKVALCCVMGVGALSASCAIAKAILLKNLFAQDYTWHITKPAVCTVIEHLLGITVASIPALKPLFSQILDAATSSGNSGRRSFRKIHGCEGSTPLQNTSLANYAGGDGSKLRLDDKSITKTTEFYLSTLQYLETDPPPPSNPTWPIQDFPAPPTAAAAQERG